MGTRSKKFKSTTPGGMSSDAGKIRGKMACRDSNIHLPGPERSAEMASINRGRRRVASRGPIKRLWLMWSETGLLTVAWTEADLRRTAGRLAREAPMPAKAAIPET